MKPEELDSFVSLVKESLNDYNPELEHVAELESLKLNDAIRHMCLMWEQQYKDILQHTESDAERISVISVMVATLLVENFILHAKMFKNRSESFNVNEYLQTFKGK